MTPARRLDLGSGAASVRGLVAAAGGPRLIGAGMLDATGTGLLVPLTVLFFVIHVGVPARLVGAGMSIGGLLSMCLAPVGGQLVDRLGSKRSLICAWIFGCLAVCCYVLVRRWPEIIVVIAAAGFAGNVSGTARATLIASIVDRADISHVMAIQRSFRNVGYGLGGLMATAALAAGSAGFLTAFHQVALQVALPLWIVLYTHAPRELVGLLYTLNTLVVVIAQLRISRDVRGLADAPRAYLRGALAIIAAAAGFLASHYVGVLPAVLLLLLGAVLMTAAEMYCSAADWVVSFGLADDDHRGKYLAVYSMGDSLGDAVGPSVTTALTSLGALPVWPAVAAIVACGSLASGAIARGAARNAPVAEAEPALG